MPLKSRLQRGFAVIALALLLTVSLAAQPTFAQRGQVQAANQIGTIISSFNGKSFVIRLTTGATKTAYLPARHRMRYPGGEVAQDSTLVNKAFVRIEGTYDLSEDVYNITNVTLMSVTAAGSHVSRGFREDGNVLHVSGNGWPGGTVEIRVGSFQQVQYGNGGVLLGYAEVQADGTFFFGARLGRSVLNDASGDKIVRVTNHNGIGLFRAYNEYR